MLTPEQLEAAARNLCKIRGQRTEETQMVAHRYFRNSDGDWMPDYEIKTYFMMACEEIRAHIEIQGAVQSVINKTTCDAGNRLDLHRTRDGIYLPCLPDCDVGLCD